MLENSNYSENLSTKCGNRKKAENWSRKPGMKKKKVASYLHRTAQPPTLATFRSWGSSAGAGRIRLAGANIGD